MFLPFFENLRNTGVPVSLREYLGFLEALNTGLATYDIGTFYLLGRTIMVKDERHLDRYDRAFSASFSGLEKISTDEVLNAVDIPLEWLEKLAEKHLSPEEMAEIQSAGGFDKLMEKLRERLAEQKGRHQGGSNGSGRRAHPPLAPMAITPKGCV